MSYLTPGVGFEEGLALGATIAIRIVAVVILVLGTDVGSRGLGTGLGAGLGAAGAALATGAFVLFLSIICISPCHAIVFNIIDCRTKKGGGPTDPPPLAFRDGWQILRHVP